MGQDGKLEALKAKILARSVRDGAGCLLWQGSKHPFGHGQVAVRCEDGKWRPRRTHRIIWEATHGPFPEGMCVCHRCDVPACVEVGHLFLGSHQENMADMMTKGRAASGEKLGKKGEKHLQAKLTEGQVLRVRALYAEGIPLTELARLMNVTKQNIYRIVHRYTWRHI